MKSLNQKLLVLLSALLLGGAWLAPGVAHAEDEDELSEKSDVMWGVGLRLRSIFLPEPLIELFVGDAPGGGQHIGYGLEFTRQKGNFTLAFGIEYEMLNATNGIWVERGESIPQDTVDYVEFDGFNWITADLSFIWRQRLVSDVFFLHYGAGLGIGLLRGQILQTDYACANDQTDSCVQDPNAVDIDAPADTPPVFPVVNMIVGFQIRPVKYVSINLEGGIRTVPFIGTTVGVMY
jgi:hypothetical protein